MNIPKLAASIILCQLIGIVGSFFTTPYIQSWYSSVAKPFFNPPNWIFAPAWTALFLLMGISLYLIWDSKSKLKVRKLAYQAFAIQALLNILWSGLFFAIQNPGLAFIEILLLWPAIFVTIQRFKRISKNAAYLLLPYIVWVTFAALLNFSIFILNA